MSFTIPKNGFPGFKGYVWNSRSIEYLAEPSVNCLVLEDGKAAERFGYQTEFSIGVDGSSATSIYSKTYDVAFFALDTKVYYHDFSSGGTYDSGVSLTAGTTTRFSEWFGIIFCTNTTDGVKIFVCGRLNDAAANLGDATITVDGDMGGRLIAFAMTADNLIINGTSEDMASIAVATGIATMTVNLTQSYDDNTFCLVTKSISSEKFSKIEFWKERLHGMGFLLATNADQPNNTIMAGQFVTGATAATSIELLVDFTYGTGGSTKILVYGGGKVTNIVGVKDFLYFLTEDKVFAAANTDVTTSGAAIGDTRPSLKDELHGCINEDCATIMGDSALTYITNDHRIMRIPIATDTGAAISKPEEDFDVPIRGHLKNMVKDQTGAFAFHYRGGRQTIYQLNINNQWYWFIFDHNLKAPAGGLSGGTVHGAWQPPQNISPMKSLFERDGVLYGTDVSDDTVYSIFTTFLDDTVPITSVIASGEFLVGNAMIKNAIMEGDINQPSQINLNCYVWNETLGKRTGSAKVIDGEDYSYSEDNSVGAIPIGDGGVEAATSQTATWRKEFGVFPSQASKCQLVAMNEQEGGYFTISSFALIGDSLPGTSSPSL